MDIDEQVARAVFDRRAEAICEKARRAEISQESLGGIPLREVCAKVTEFLLACASVEDDAVPDEVLALALNPVSSRSAPDQKLLNTLVAENVADECGILEIIHCFVAPEIPGHLSELPPAVRTAAIILYEITIRETFSDLLQYPEIEEHLRRRSARAG